MRAKKDSEERYLLVSHVSKNTWHPQPGDLVITSNIKRRGDRRALTGTSCSVWDHSDADIHVQLASKHKDMGITSIVGLRKAMEKFRASQQKGNQDD